MKKMGLMKGKNLDSAFPAKDYPRVVATAGKADTEMEFCRRGPCLSSGMPLLIELMEGGKA